MNTTKLANNLFLFICLLLSLFLTLSGFLSINNQSQTIFQLLFLPVTGYFVYAFISQLITKQNQEVISAKRTPINIGLIVGLVIIVVWKIFTLTQ